MAWNPEAHVSPEVLAEIRRIDAGLLTAANQIQAEAFRAFDRWRAEHDPDGELDVLDAATAYSKWAGKNSIAPYLDAHPQS